MRTKSFVLAAALFGGILVACSDSSGPNSGGRQLGLMVTAQSDPAATAESVVVGSHVLALDSVKLVLREIELKRVAGSATCSSAPNPAPATSNDHGSKTGMGDHHECLEFEVGPVLLDLPLGGGPQRVVSVAADTGTFRELEFEIHRPTMSTADQDFLTAHPEYDGVSVRVVGTYDGKPFVFTSGVSARQETDLDPALVITDATPTNLTLQVEVGSWFIAGGVGLIDPAAAAKGGPAEFLVAQNIRRSFRVFEDRNHDGWRDHDH